MLANCTVSVTIQTIWRHFCLSTRSYLRVSSWFPWRRLVARADDQSGPVGGSAVFLAKASSEKKSFLIYSTLPPFGRVVGGPESRVFGHFKTSHVFKCRLQGSPQSVEHAPRASRSDTCTGGQVFLLSVGCRSLGRPVRVLSFPISSSGGHKLTRLFTVRRFSGDAKRSKSLPANCRLLGAVLQDVLA